MFIFSIHANHTLIRSLQVHQCIDLKIHLLVLIQPYSKWVSKMNIADHFQFSANRREKRNILDSRFDSVDHTRTFCSETGEYCSQYDSIFAGPLCFRRPPLLNFTSAPRKAIYLLNWISIIVKNFSFYGWFIFAIYFCTINSYAIRNAFSFDFCQWRITPNYFKLIIINRFLAI